MAGGGGVGCADPSAVVLLPRTFSSKKAAAVVSVNSEEQELEAIQDFFTSVILTSSAESIEEAKNISNGAEDPSKLHCEDGDGAGVANGKYQVQGRRPALGRKRARFSFNPNVSDSHLNVNLKSSVDHIEDPDELFLAFENIERAKEELKKQMGEVAVDSSPNMHWAAARKRRPGILGRKASYKHHFPEHFNTAEALVPSQGENQTFSPSKTRNDANSNVFSQQVTQPGTTSGVETNDFFDTSDREGFTADRKKEVDKLLDTLLHCFEDIDKGEEIDFLQTRLQIKSTNVDKIYLPPLDGIRVNDVRKMDSKFSAEKIDGSSKIHVSPTVASSPLAAISVLRRRISQIDPLNNPFSMFSSNEKPSPENSSSDEGSKGRTPPSPLYEHPDMAGIEVENASDSEHLSEARIKFLQTTVSEADMIIPSNIALGDSEDLHCRTNGITDNSARHAVVGSISFNTSREDNARVGGMPLGVISEEADCGKEELPSGTLVGGNVGASAGLFESRGPGSLDNDINIDSFQTDNVAEDKVDDVEEAPPSDEGGKGRTLSSPLYEHPDMAGMQVKNASGSEHRSEARIQLLQSTVTEADMIIPGNIMLGDSEDLHCRTNGITENSARRASAKDTTNAVGSISLNTSPEDNARVDGMPLGVISEEADCDKEELLSGTLVGGNVGASAGLFESRGPGSLDNGINIDSFQSDNVVEDKVDDGEEGPASGGQDQTSINDAADIPVDGCCGNSSIPPKQNDKENQSDLTASINYPVELEAPRKRQNKQGTGARRHSLAGAGMSWQSGVRRSTRIRMKPLEYWRGERLLYARIHDSLPTLVGVKYSSPAEAGHKRKQVLKVRSYVSEEYAGLVQKIALH